MNAAVGIILLAAGASTRMGQSKQLLAIDGKSLLLKSAEAAVGASSEVIVVLGANADLHRTVLAGLPVTTIENKNWSKGMGSSLKTGLHALLENFPNIKAVIIMVCDQPLISAAYLQELKQAFIKTGSAVIASAYADTVGVPALFDQSMFKVLVWVKDEHGAKKILQSHPHTTIDFPGGAIDLDTPQDYQSFVNR